jgi:hypothetical protein
MQWSAVFLTFSIIHSQKILCHFHEFRDWSVEIHSLYCDHNHFLFHQSDLWMSILSPRSALDWQIKSGSDCDKADRVSVINRMQKWRDCRTISHNFLTNCFSWRKLKNLNDRNIFFSILWFREPSRDRQILSLSMRENRFSSSFQSIWRFGDSVFRLWKFVKLLPALYRSYHMSSKFFLFGSIR